MAPKKNAEQGESAEKPAREYTRRTPAERAQSELDSANKRVEKAEARVEKAQAEVEKAQKELSRAQRFAEFAAENPDLPESDTVTAPGEAGTGTDPDVVPGTDASDLPTESSDVGEWAEGEKIDANA